MRIGLHDSDNTGFPNLALMKLSAYHKSQGDKVSWFNPLWGKCDKLYSSKVFTWTKTDPYVDNHESLIMGGIGGDITKTLPDEIEHICPDYSLYDGEGFSLGFTTRGCIRKCPWCFVPKKEGGIKANADVDEFLRHNKIVLMDNNILAHDHGIQQLHKIKNLGVKLDCNQGLDSRLIDVQIASLLSEIKWTRFIRLACDDEKSLETTIKAIRLLEKHGVKTYRVFVYCLIKDVTESHDRIKKIASIGADPFGQPYRNASGTEPTAEQKRLARWCNHKGIFKSTKWEDYR